MKRTTMILGACMVCLLAAGCQNFWANYYAIQPGLTDKATVKNLLGQKPYVEIPERLIYQAPKKDKHGIGQEVIIYFNDKGICVARRRKNPLQLPPPGENGETVKDEVVGTIPEPGRFKSSVKVRSK